MPIAVVFWIVMLLWLVLGLWFRYSWPPSEQPAWRVLVPDLFPFVALALLGWHVFGPAIR